jgi:F-type H+-transporting ATPase subunit b
VLIDWFTVGAQALNFLIMVWLLKRYLYKPVLDAISARERRIAMQLADAASKQAAATSERDEFDRKNKEFDAQRTLLLTKAGEEAKLEQQRLLEQARKDADALRSRLEDALRSEQQILSGELARRTRDEVFAIARKVLADLASTSLEDMLLRVFIERLRALNAADRQLLAAASASGSVTASPGGAVVVRSAYDLSAQQRSAIEQAVTEVCGTAVRPSYETVPALISGLELSVNGRKLAWSITDYLGALQKSVADILAASATLSTPSAPAASASAASTTVQAVSR